MTLLTCYVRLTISQRFCEEVVRWKILCHPNILPLLGATMSENRFVMVSEWMMKGNINEFVRMDPNADRLGLVCFLVKALICMHR